MEILRGSLLPRRLTQMYTDTKRSYEQIVQTNITNPQLSALHLKLRIQKDRLIAWGLEWADSNPGQSDDIDSSLDRAGISDLVASIMSSIRELLDEAERIQPQSRPQIPGSYPIDKAFLLNSNIQWTPANLARLEDIVRDITTSIDTLCDLSRSQQAMHQDPNPQKFEKPPQSENAEKTSQIPAPPAKNNNSNHRDFLKGQSDLTSSSRIDPKDLTYPTRTPLPAATPPSYNSTATDPGNRSFAFFRTSSVLGQTSTWLSKPRDTPVLVDFYSEDGTMPSHAPWPSLQRFEDLILCLQGPSRTSALAYTGCLTILGWLRDPRSSRYAFVYELPQPTLRVPPLSNQVVQPCSLLSYLQHSGDTDSSNVPCLEDRFRLGMNLVSTLLHVHAKGLTHRNINSNNIIFVGQSESKGSESKPWKEGAIRKPYLVSWDHCTEDTAISEHETLISNIYRHPGIERWQRSSYCPAHDIYSLGLVLLEIGLWMPLNKLWKTKYSRSGFKSRLQTIYAEKLAAKCGDAYMGAVDYCLRAVDKAHTARTSIGIASRDQQGKVQNEYYWSVLKPLERCCKMDESDEPRITPATFALTAQSNAEDRAVNPYAATENQLSHPANTIEVLHVPLEHPEWKTRKGFSPQHPGGVDLPVWSYKVDDASKQYFHKVMAPKIDWMADKAIDIKESYELSVCMTGSSRDSAKPTVLMVCRSLSLAWRILKHVNEEKKLFDIYVAPGELRRSKAKKKKKGSNNKKIAKGEDKPGQQPSRYQQKPTCGASIGCFVDEQHSEAVTFGGMVLVDGELHGMSVHHMLEDPTAGPDQADVAEPPPEEMSDFFVAFDDMPSDMPDPIWGLEDLPDGFDALEILEAEAEGKKNAPTGDLLGVKPGQGETIIVTQPALDDIDVNYFEDQSEMSDDHLCLHGLGTIHASSGLRRLKYEDVAHEIDWALFKMHDDRRPITNVVEGGNRHCKTAAQNGYPSQVLKAGALGDLDVHAFGSTSGLETGKIRSEMELTRMPGRRFQSPVWRFEGNFGEAGDSGAWIIDNETGGLCGHVSSYSESQQSGVLAPTEAQLQDMEETLSVKVALPVREQDVVRSFKDQIIHQQSTESTNLRGGDRTLSQDSEYESGSEQSEEDWSNVDRSPTQSPVLATSPASSSSRKTSVREPLSLNSVAEKWESTQASKQGGGRERGSTTDDKLGGKVHVREELEARC